MKYYKKVTLTEKEVKDLELGNIHSEKQTESYQKAQKFFQEEKERLVAEGETLTNETHFWFDNKNHCFKMRFTTINTFEQSNPLYDHFDIFNNLFR